MKKILLVLITLLSVKVNAQIGTNLRGVGLFGNNVDQQKNCIDEYGNSYVLGYYTQGTTPDIDPGPGTTLLPNTNSCFLAKINTAGNLVWYKAFGSNNSTYNFNGIKAQYGTVYMYGNYSGSQITYDNLYTVQYGGNQGFIIAASTTDGSGQSFQCYQGSSSQAADVKGISFNSAGYVYILINFNGTFIFNNTQYTSRDYDIAVLSMGLGLVNKYGSFVIGGASYDVGYDIFSYAPEQNSFYITGLFTGTVDFSTDASSQNLTSMDIGGSSQFIAKYIMTSYNPFAGNVTWKQQIYTGANSGISNYSNSLATAMEPYSTGILHNIYVAGAFNYEVNVAGINITNSYQTSSFLAQIDAGSGYASVVKELKSPTGNGQTIKSIQVDNDKSVFVSGDFYNNLLMDFYSPYSDTLKGDPNYTRTYVAKYDQNLTYVSGGVLNAKGNSGERLACMVIDTVSKALNLIGYTSGSADFDLTAGYDTISLPTTSFGHYFWQLGNCFMPVQSATVSITSCSGLQAQLSHTSTNPNSPTTLWYSSATGSTEIGKGNPFITPSAINANTDFYFADSTACGISPRSKYTVVSHQSPVVAAYNAHICSGTTYTLWANGAATYTYSSGNPVVSPITQTTYTITGADSLGCLGKDTLTVFINSVPTVSVTTSKSSICVGDSAVLTATPSFQTSGTDLIAYYKFDEGIGYTTADYSGNGLTATLVKGNSYLNGTLVMATPFSPLFSGSSYALFLNRSPGSGNNYTTNNYVTVNDNAYFNDMANKLTLEAWINPESGWNGAIIDRGANDFLFEVFATTGNISQLGFYNNGVWSYSPLGAVVWGAWQHVAVTYDGATREIKFYVNGVVVSTQTRTVPLIVNGGDVNIGRQGPNNCQCNPFIGWLDEVKIWRTVRTQAQIQASLISVNKPAVYTWNPSANLNLTSDTSAVVKPTATTVYTITINDLNSCSNSSTITQSVNVVNAATNTSNNVITASQSGATYQWVNCANNIAIVGATAQSYTATANGNYKVVVTSANCSDTSACISVTTVGVEKYAANINVSIYPNPNNGSFVVTTTENAKTIVVSDLLGNELLSVTPTNPSTTIILSTQANGIYFVKISTDNAQIIKRIVINN